MPEGLSAVLTERNIPTHGGERRPSNVDNYGGLDRCHDLCGDAGSVCLNQHEVEEAEKVEEEIATYHDLLVPSWKFSEVEVRLICLN